ncbi:ABC-type transport auxiliary lipoprotein family protein [Aliarcobacter cryaerophilus]|uniref:ABC-type transport auxiliary lipoprotein family protein n=1 Tax=Aliarcobacter cryaerophilus TaxID=28198 RepID=UPI0021B24AE1|nr:ABC-type transport auxiliary lipoprotein family protein [Aliarcobacter cryaerophilus]MCT7444365.1 ABC-type transport auxiliary lipoprotein family protein [Aliarcobacter cryaerophilus]MCT7479195.1 ABC-type transport auxiliary lipoprotein family protein [Aliarcobacter cryaerophilus]
MKQNKILFASKSTFLVFIIFFIFSGCGLKQESLSINHYGIDFKTQKKAEVSKLKSILIEEVNVNRSFNLTSIFYSTKPYLFEEYAQNRWINLPSNMIYNQLTDSFITSNIFENVVLKDKKIEHEYSLKTEVIKLYQTFEEDKSYAVLKLKFDLVKDEKIVKSFNFDKKVLCKSSNAYGFVQATNKAFEESINSLLSSF